MENKLEQPVSQNQQGETIRPFEVDDSLLSRAATFVTTSKTNFESQREAWVDRMDELDRAYRCKLEDEDKRNYVGIGDKAAPIIHDNVEAIVSRLKESILPTDDLVEIEAEADPQILKFRSNELNTQLEKQDIRNKVDTACRMLTKFGTAIINVPFVNSSKTVLTRQIITETINTPIIDDNNDPIIDPQTGQPMVHTEQKQSIQVVPELDIKYFGPAYNVINNLEDIYLDPLIEDPQDQPIIIQKVYATWGDLMELTNKGVYFKDQILKVKDSTTNKNWVNNDARKEENSGMGGSVDVDGKPKVYEVLQAYCDFSIPDKDQEGNEIEKVYPCVISVIGNTCIQLQQNPYFHQMKPFILARYRKIEGEAYGMSAIDPVLELYQEYNDTMNQINDSKALALNPIKIQRAGSLASKQDLDIEPGTTWYEQQNGDIRFAQFDFSPISNGLQYLELLEQRINRGMGITPLIMGQGDETDLDKTWRGTNKLIGEADKKFKSIAIDIEDALIRQWAEMAYKVNCQFNPIMGQNSFREINGEVGFKVEGVENYFEKYEKIMNLQAFVAQAGNVPGINVPGLINEAADLLKITIDPKYGPIYMPPPPPPPDSKPMNMSVTIPLDPSKGTWMAMAAADLLNKKEGLQLDLDAIGKAGNMITYGTPPEAKAESGILPPQKDSYSKEDKRTKK